jgi:hypothetical protein
MLKNIPYAYHLCINHKNLSSTAQLCLANTDTLRFNSLHLEFLEVVTLLLMG